MYEKLASEGAEGVFSAGRTFLLVVVMVVLALSFLPPLLGQPGYSACMLSTVGILVIGAAITLHYGKKESSHCKRILESVSDVDRELMREFLIRSSHELAKALEKKNAGYSEAKEILKLLAIAISKGTYDLEEAKNIIRTKVAFFELSYTHNILTTEKNSKGEWENVYYGLLRFRYRNPTNIDVDDMRVIEVPLRVWEVKRSISPSLT